MYAYYTSNQIMLTSIATGYSDVQRSSLLYHEDDWQYQKQPQPLRVQFLEDSYPVVISLSGTMGQATVSVADAVLSTVKRGAEYRLRWLASEGCGWHQCDNNNTSSIAWFPASREETSTTELQRPWNTTACP